MSDFAELPKFATRYAKAWCSQDPDSVAAFFAENGSLSVNDGPPAVGRAAIAEVARAFMRDFPDMVVKMGYGLVRTGRNEVPLDINRNEHRTGRHRKTRSNQRLRTLEDRQGRTHQRIERPFRQRRIRTPAQGRCELPIRSITCKIDNYLCRAFVLLR